MGQGTEACADRPTEVSVIRFVSRNRTIEEIAPKKEVYTCKQRGCGKIFTNQDEYKTHEALEALKIRFVCREPGCGEELSDPGSMWRHYQEHHNNETNGFVCPYTSCSSVHSTAENLEDHIESCHRQPPTLPIEPEIICFEGVENSIDEESNQNDEDCYVEGEIKVQQTQNECRTTCRNDYSMSNIEYTTTNDEYTSTEDRMNSSESNPYQAEEYSHDHKKITATSKTDEYLMNSDTANRVSTKSQKNDNVSIVQEDFVIKYDSRSSQCNDMLHVEASEDENNVVYINGDVTITKNLKIGVTNHQGQEHRIDLGNLEKVFRSGFERDSATIEANSNVDRSNNCLEDEEYTPKKQRMSRYKQEPYKCDISGCGKMYKYISHYRHHQDSHKLVSNNVSTKPAKTVNRPKQGKASSVSFFLCKMPGCGAQISNVTSLWKHYHDNHANTKPPLIQAAKGSEIFRCKIPNCDMEFNTSLMLYKHFNDVHTNGSATANASTNGKTGNGSSIRFTDEMFQDNATAHQANFKTDFKAKYNVNVDDYSESGKEQKSLPRIKEESRD